MRAVCISTFNYYNIRMHAIEKYLVNKGYEVVYVTGDYDTMTRQNYTLNIKNSIQLPMIPYHKNISFNRIFSHIDFSKKVYKVLHQLEPDFIYAMVPPNFIAYYTTKYKRKHPHVKVMFDVFDMWPESFPIANKKLLMLPFKMWEGIRTHSLKKADVIVTECQLFKKRLLELNGNSHCDVLYPFKKEEQQENIVKNNNEKVLTLAYLGSINNIIDIDHIMLLIDKCIQYQPIICHIIGGGEKHEQFMTRLIQSGVTVINHGNIYDVHQKQHIFNQCDFGINILKPSVYIGLTLKTIDYFYAGLPILNTILADTQHFVERYNAGIMVNTITEDVVYKIVHLTSAEKKQLSIQAKWVYDNFLSQQQFEKKLDNIFNKGL